MTAPVQSESDLDALPESAVALGRIALMAGLIRGDLGKCLTAAEADAVVSLLNQIAEYSDTIRDTAADLADALGCGPETVEAVKAGMGRVSAFRACRGLEGSA